jgi:hypothetical protein
MQSNLEKHEPACLLAHDLVNKLSAIIGYCDLLIEKAEENTECAKRLSLIRKFAQSAAKELADHQCQLSSVIRSAKAQKHLAM